MSEEKSKDSTEEIYDNQAAAAESLRPHPVTIRGETFQIVAFKWGQLLRLGGALDRVLSAIGSVLSSPKVPISEIAFFSTQIAEAVSPYADDVEKAMAMATGKSVQWVQGLEKDEAQELFTAIVSAHTYSFVTRLRKRSEAILGRYERLASEMQSKNSFRSPNIPGTSSGNTPSRKSGSHSHTRNSGSGTAKRRT
jgi:hypothetical protein